MAPEIVTLYRMSGKRGKNNAADAAAICEAVQQPNMRFVPVKTEDRQAELMVRRARQGRAELPQSSRPPSYQRPPALATAELFIT